MSGCVRVRIAQGLPGPPGADGGTSSEITAQVDSTVVPGTPVYSTIGSHFEIAQADALGTTKAIGLSLTATSAGSAADVQTQDIVTLTTVQWDAVTGGSGGLTSGSTYYLGGAAPGTLVTVPPALPVSTHNVRIGVALTSVTMDVKIRAPLKL